MANLPNAFIDDAAVTALDARVPDAVTGTGMYHCGSNAPGVGIGTDNPNLEQSLPNWTLLDQHGNARNAQISQLIGGTGITDVADYPSSGGTEGTLPDSTVRLWVNPDNVDGVPDNNALPTADNSAVLLDLAVGWTSAVPTP